MVAYLLLLFNCSGKESNIATPPVREASVTNSNRIFPTYAAPNMPKQETKPSSSSVKDEKYEKSTSLVEDMINAENVSDIESALSKGADPTFFIDRIGKTFFELAVIEKEFEIVDILLKHIKIDSVKNIVNDPLVVAVHTYILEDNIEDKSKYKEVCLKLIDLYKRQNKKFYFTVIANSLKPHLSYFMINLGLTDQDIIKAIAESSDIVAFETLNSFINENEKRDDLKALILISYLARLDNILIEASYMYCNQGISNSNLAREMLEIYKISKGEISLLYAPKDGKPIMFFILLSLNKELLKELREAYISFEGENVKIINESNEATFKSLVSEVLVVKIISSDSDVEEEHRNLLEDMIKDFKEQFLADSKEKYNFMILKQREKRVDSYIPMSDVMDMHKRGEDLEHISDSYAARFLDIWDLFDPIEGKLKKSSSNKRTLKKVFSNAISILRPSSNKNNTEVFSSEIDPIKVLEESILEGKSDEEVKAHTYRLIDYYMQLENETVTCLSSEAKRKIQKRLIEIRDALEIKVDASKDN